MQNKTYNKLFINAGKKTPCSDAAKSTAPFNSALNLSANMKEIIQTNNKTARIAGILFVLGFAGVLTVGLTSPILDDPDYLIKISVNANHIILGALFQFIMGAACAGIGISLYPILRKYNEGLALGAAGFRIIEGALFIVGVIGLLLLLTLSQEFVKAGALKPSYFQTLGALLLSVRDWVLLTGTLAWCIGALMYYYIFYQTKLIPQWLSGWGFVGITLAIGANMLVMFRLTNPMSTIQTVLNIPIFFNEVVLALWLIVKGFNPSVVVSESASRAERSEARR